MNVAYPLWSTVGQSLMPKMSQDIQIRKELRLSLHDNANSFIFFFPDTYFLFQT